MDAEDKPRLRSYVDSNTRPAIVTRARKRTSSDLFAFKNAANIALYEKSGFELEDTLCRNTGYVDAYCIS